MFAVKTSAALIPLILLGLIGIFALGTPHGRRHLKEGSAAVSAPLLRIPLPPKLKRQTGRGVGLAERAPSILVRSSAKTVDSSGGSGATSASLEQPTETEKAGAVALKEKFEAITSEVAGREISKSTVRGMPSLPRNPVTKTLESLGGSGATNSSLKQQTSSETDGAVIRKEAMARKVNVAAVSPALTGLEVPQKVGTVEGWANMKTSRNETLSRQHNVHGDGKDVIATNASVADEAEESETE